MSVEGFYELKKNLKENGFKLKKTYDHDGGREYNIVGTNIYLYTETCSNIDPEDLREISIQDENGKYLVTCYDVDEEITFIADQYRIEIKTFGGTHFPIKWLADC